ncbi:peptide/nickel transport system substrate-binding protein [Stella humosa]|uniref:Peptide/nickel transport system substrate-binding protein n=1 Tax=Stella humosa TaxID=94 RepID=A0A3N1KUB8_9PROT|nr:ABC transporter substrate-binding protein [Stella humosa]ROP84171.1 peptide/nickel transport system substrate-binding protein [Stella humosa]BBK33682.1 ABC transporter substrate-binding protein [Stella humosa]
MRKFLSAVAIAAALAGPAAAADLTVGARFDPSIDPHFLYLSTNMAYAQHMFEPLVARDSDSQPIPGLAESWRALDDTTWEFKLRRGVRFHDGQEFTAADVQFTVRRVPALANNPSAYTGALRSVVSTEAPDPYTVIFRTDKPNPILPSQFTIMSIVSHKAAADATPADFASGKAAIGTGPYRFVRYARGERLELERYADYRGPAPAWDKVTFRFIPNPAARVAALLAGDVDMIDYVPTADLPRLKSDARSALFTRASDRVIYLVPNVGPDTMAGLTTKAGEALDRNPLRDARVRRALSLAINRPALVDRVMEGFAAPAGQLVPQGFFGYDPAIAVPPFDLARSRALLAEAGWPDGFGMTVACTTDRYVNDAAICQALAQMWARAGIAMKVETYPSNVFFTKVRTGKSELPMMLLGWGSSSTGDSSGALTGLLHSIDAPRGYGAYNFGAYASAEVDQKIETATTTMDAAQRLSLMQGAMRAAVEDGAIIALHTQMTAVATRKGIAYTPRADEWTMATHASPAR